MLLMISLKNITVGVRLWNMRFVLRFMILSASADLLPILSAARNRRLSMWRKPRFRLNTSRHMPCLTGRGFLYLSPSHPVPKNRNGPSFNPVAHTRHVSPVRVSGFLLDSDCYCQRYRSYPEKIAGNSDLPSRIAWEFCVGQTGAAE